MNIDVRGIAKNIPTIPKTAPNTITEKIIIAGCIPSFLPIIFGVNK